jgi:hypothetical protein
MPRSLNNSETKSLSTVLSSDLSVILNQRDLTLRLRRLMSMKSKSMEERSKTKLNSLTLYSRKRSLLIKFSKTSRPLMSSEPLKVKDSAELSRDSESRNFQERHTEV